MTTGAWRADIDGLRALAVLSVIAFHAGLAGVTGGYVGVDVFFVISGYLIAGNIYAGVERGHFTLAGFYERRIRRIQPALIAMLAVCAVVFAGFLTPIDYKTFAQSVGASLTFCSNLFFYFKSGYFDAGAETNPLLHTWSLAVEEQYYLAFPLLVMALHRLLPRRTTLAIALLMNTRRFPAVEAETSASIVCPGRGTVGCDALHTICGISGKYGIRVSTEKVLKPS